MKKNRKFIRNQSKILRIKEKAVLKWRKCGKFNKFNKS